MAGERDLWPGRPRVVAPGAERATVRLRDDHVIIAGHPGGVSVISLVDGERMVDLRVAL